MGARDVPHVDGRVVAGGQQESAGQGGADTGEAGLGVGRREVLVDLLVASDVPQPHSPVLTAGHKAQAGGMNRDGVHVCLVTPERLNTARHPEVPHSHSSPDRLSNISLSVSQPLPVH